MRFHRGYFVELARDAMIAVAMLVFIITAVSWPFAIIAMFA